MGKIDSSNRDNFIRKKNIGNKNINKNDGVFQSHFDGIKDSLEEENKRLSFFLDEETVLEINDKINAIIEELQSNYGLTFNSLSEKGAI